MRSPKILILGIILTLVAAYGIAEEGSSPGTLLMLGVGILMLISNFPPWQIGRLNMTLLAQSCLFAGLAFVMALQILAGDATVTIKHVPIPFGAYAVALGSGGISIYGLLAAFGLIKSD